MTNEGIKLAKQEAIRFLDRVQQFESLSGAEREHSFYGSKETGAIRRSSLDLSRALADMRK